MCVGAWSGRIIGYRRTGVKMSSSLLLTTTTRNGDGKNDNNNNNNNNNNEDNNKDSNNDNNIIINNNSGSEEKGSGGSDDPSTFKLAVKESGRSRSPRRRRDEGNGRDEKNRKRPTVGLEIKCEMQIADQMKVLEPGVGENPPETKKKEKRRKRRKKIRRKRRP